MQIKRSLVAAVALLTIIFTPGKCIAQQTVKDALKGKFLIGAAINDDQVTGKDSLSDKILIQHFNSITAENCMKSEVVQPEEGKFDFTQADRFIAFGEKLNMSIHGHVLIWHSQAPKWFFVDKNGKDVSRKVLIERMKKYITTVMKRYKGRIKSWDVVNEAIMDDGSFRPSKFYQIIGEDYIRLAFQFARKADPKALLIYNDYSMALPGKREGVVKMIRNLQKQGVKVDGIGMQGHFSMDFPTVADEEKSIEAFAALGVKISISELDMTVLPSPYQGADVAQKVAFEKGMNPYANGLPDSVSTTWNNRMGEFFRLFLKHSDQISRVTLWGVTDHQTWRNDWPIRGRKDYPLLFDRNYQPKAVVQTIIEEASR
ncbi:endo-1,4-beta-xylanase [Parabacteroides sp. FAFU027]|uniref:endo-1,4-beta-xylanase n=1 Tax=Parabacteroides sp. FAFU027 TaxID=2922715 RepID=UPI001FAF8BA5|nr:endo-1,4-beta-xylanase [Parabacteroides sp. FAFU027]